MRVDQATVAQVTADHHPILGFQPAPVAVSAEAFVLVGVGADEKIDIGIRGTGSLAGSEDSEIIRCRRDHNQLGAFQCQYSRELGQLGFIAIENTDPDAVDSKHRKRLALLGMDVAERPVVAFIAAPKVALAVILQAGAVRSINNDAVIVATFPRDIRRFRVRADDGDIIILSSLGDFFENLLPLNDLGQLVSNLGVGHVVAREEKLREAQQVHAMFFGPAGNLLQHGKVVVNGFKVS